MKNENEGNINSSIDPYLRLREVLFCLQIGKTTFYRWILEGIAPAPVKAGPRISLWRRSDIEKLMTKLDAASTEDKLYQNKS